MKNVSDGERLMQYTLNKKYMELEQKDKQIAQLQKEIDCLKLMLSEKKETIGFLCSQISRLFLKQKSND